jgi:hypothetical protein
MHMVFPLLGFKTNPGMSSHAPPPPTLSPGGMAEKPSRSIICIWNICNKGRVPRFASYTIYMSPLCQTSISTGQLKLTDQKSKKTLYIPTILCPLEKQYCSFYKNIRMKSRVQSLIYFLNRSYSVFFVCYLLFFFYRPRCCILYNLQVLSQLICHFDNPNLHGQFILVRGLKGRSPV